MSKTDDRMYDRYVYLHLDYGLDGCGTTISVKLDDEGVVVDAWSDDECVASTWTVSYTHLTLPTIYSV